MVVINRRDQRSKLLEVIASIYFLLTNFIVCTCVDVVYYTLLKIAFYVIEATPFSL